MSNSYMQIAGYTAHPEDPKKGWIAIKSIAYGITAEIGKFEQGKPRQINRSEHNELEVKKPMDRSSLFLSQQANNQTVIKQITFAFTREDEKDVYLKCEITDCYITEISIDVDDGEDPEESVKLSYTSLTWKYRPKIKGDKLGDWEVMGWDRQKRKDLVE